MNRIFSYIIISLLITSHLIAQTDPKTQEILKGVSAKYKSYKSLGATFKLSILDQSTKKVSTQNGSITLRGNQFNLIMNDQTVMSDGKTTWTYLKESNEVQISDNKPAGEGISPTTIFTLYEKGYKTKFLANKTVNKKAIQVVELIPEDNKKSFIKIEISIDKQGKYVSEAKVFDKSGSIYTYSITKFTPNTAITDDLFTFNKAKYPGIDVIDLR